MCVKLGHAEFQPSIAVVQGEHFQIGG